MNETVERVMRAALTMQRASWEQGTTAQAFLEAGETETALLMALEAVNRQTADGRCAQMGADIAATDACAIGEALIFACEMTGDERLSAAKERLLGWALEDAPRSGDGIVYHLLGGKEFWVDSMYMLPPFLARAGHYDEALRQIDGLWNALYLPEKGLLAHRWDDCAHRFIRKDVWGVGNGWAMAGMARVRALLPEAYAREKCLLKQRVRTLIDHAIPLQCPDGMFRDVLDDPSAFPEVNFGQMLAYTVYRGVKEGWLEESYLSAAERCFTAALREVDAFGLVRNVCGAPSFDRPGVAPEGQAFFILMNAVREKLWARE